MAKKKKGYDELGDLGVLNYLGAYGSPASSAGASDEQMGSQDLLGSLAGMLADSTLGTRAFEGLTLGRYGGDDGVMEMVGDTGFVGELISGGTDDLLKNLTGGSRSSGKSGGLGSLSKMFS
tara:strand:+ start:786 stop:1148 length:363 start_codon:yes stop_codon:yes gene_type:complete